MRAPLRLAITAATTIAVTAITVLTGVPAVSAASAQLAADQSRLNSLGCDAGTADGVDGAHTRAAAWRFQSANGLSRDGIIGLVTRSRLYASSAKRCDKRPVPPSSGTGRRIVVSQTHDWMWLVRSDGTVLSQGGVIDNPGVLAKGTYYSGPSCGGAAHILHHIAEGGAILDNFSRFAPCGIGFHRIPRYPSSGAQIHPDWMLGTEQARSHGCVRLSLTMSLRVWDFTAPATMVRVI
jgi:peptidoglycan hydrolase-like protein with peptidoglycan-binding domain